MSFTAGDVMDRAAALLNDAGKTIFSYTVQLPYLNSAIDELNGVLESNDIDAFNDVSADLKVAIGVLYLDQSTSPAIPADLVEIQKVSERPADSEDPFSEMQRVEFLPDIEQQTSLIYYAWQDQKLKFNGATSDREVRLEYITSGIPLATSSSSAIFLINAKNFLAFRTAALCAMYVGENPTRAGALDTDADGQLDWLIRISVKGTQVIPTRRRPFMASYKARGW